MIRQTALILLARTSSLSLLLDDDSILPHALSNSHFTNLKISQIVFDDSLRSCASRYCLILRSMLCCLAKLFSAVCTLFFKLYAFILLTSTLVHFICKLLLLQQFYLLVHTFYKNGFFICMKFVHRNRNHR